MQERGIPWSGDSTPAPKELLRALERTQERIQAHVSVRKQGKFIRKG